MRKNADGHGYIAFSSAAGTLTGKNRFNIYDADLRLVVVSADSESNGGQIKQQHRQGDNHERVKATGLLTSHVTK